MYVAAKLIFTNAFAASAKSLKLIQSVTFMRMRVGMEETAQMELGLDREALPAL